MSPSSPERLVRFIVEVREREGSNLRTDTEKLRGVIVDMIKIEDMNAAVTLPSASVDDVLNQRAHPNREVTVPAFPLNPLNAQLYRLANYASIKRSV